MQMSQRDAILKTLELNLLSFEYFVEGVTQSEAQTFRDTKPDGSDGWTILEVMSHLRNADEQFVVRLECALENSDKGFPALNPDELAQSGNFNAGILDDVMSRFKANRKKMLTAFEAVEFDQWDYTGIHPVRGRTSVADLLVLAAQHDAKHIKQLSRMFSKR